MYLTGARVHQYLIDLGLKPVRADPDRQQQMLEGDARVSRCNLMHALLVAANILPRIAFNLGRHDGFGLLKPIAQFELVALCFVSRQISRLIRLQFHDVPRFKRGESLG